MQLLCLAGEAVRGSPKAHLCARIPVVVDADVGRRYVVLDVIGRHVKPCYFHKALAGQVCTAC
jgi:hypothetical protein